jgi:hypothetical protein
MAERIHHDGGTTIGLPDAASATSLSEHLERCGCVVGRLDARTLAVAPPPRSIESEYALLEVMAYVRVWRELNPGVELELEPEPGERSTAQ